MTQNKEKETKKNWFSLFWYIFGCLPLIEFRIDTFEPYVLWCTQIDMVSATMLSALFSSISNKNLHFPFTRNTAFASNYDGPSIGWFYHFSGFAFYNIFFLCQRAHFSCVSSPAAKWNKYLNIVWLMGKLLLTSLRRKSHIVFVIDVGRDFAKKNIYNMYTDPKWRLEKGKKIGFDDVEPSRWQWALKFQFFADALSHERISQSTIEAHGTMPEWGSINQCTPLRQIINLLIESRNLMCNHDCWPIADSEM